MHSALNPFKFTHHYSESIIHVSIKKAIARINFPKMWEEKKKNPKLNVMSENSICLNHQDSIFFLSTFVSLKPK